MSKQLLVLYELMDDQIEDLKMCAKDYEIIFSPCRQAVCDWQSRNGTPTGKQESQAEESAA